MNVFEFNTYDLDKHEQEYYHPFRYEIPKTGLYSIEDFINFCKNVAVLLSFSEESFNEGIADYLDQIGYYDKNSVSNEQIEGLAEKIIKSKSIKPIKECCDGFYDCKDDDYESPCV